MVQGIFLNQGPLEALGGSKGFSYVPLYNRLRHIGIWAWDWTIYGGFLFSLGVGVGGRSHSNFLASTVIQYWATTRSTWAGDVCSLGPSLYMSPGH